MSTTLPPSSDGLVPTAQVRQGETESERTALFDALPPDLFKPLASPTRRLTADLLLHLHERTFGFAADAPRRTEVLREIADFVVRWEAANGRAGADDGEAPATSIEDRARIIYQRLLDTGWLLEHRDRYIRLVDLDPDASGLLHVLARIARGETRSYGGAVLGVLSALENAAANPVERSENLRNALNGAQDFMAHMRMVSVSLRKIEERILRQHSPREVIRHFFEDFVERHLIADFKTLHTKNNPFRFRSAIIRQAHSISGDPLTVLALAEAYYREGRAPSLKAGEETVLRELAGIAEIFEATERHLATIDATAARIEKQVMNTARSMDRVGGRSETRLAEALRAVAGAPDSQDGIPVRTALLLRILPIGPSHIPTPRRERAPIPPAVVREEMRDPALDAYAMAKADYVRTTRVTPQGLTAFLDAALGRKGAVRGSEIRIETVEDFVSFQRLREIGSIFDGAVARHFEIELLDGRVSNAWITCQDFVIRRKEARAR